VGQALACSYNLRILGGMIALNFSFLKLKGKPIDAKVVLSVSFVLFGDRFFCAGHCLCATTQY